ncbi:glycosyl hydrolase family 28-related protein [Paenibacillus albus]|uniref:Rhamnogalacturonase A/B/Epimerase-like pectate lyase domain-containing protein n=1 Tax=Paenibacillus albus TaxID=2495582 RepID=A0A3Q8XAH0_9BACL|nr:glycosyl hydrolase family 28-related protein [Paenibacillus albus]AZN43317.1 hypothetical protein EJC50_29220 [Paenibacillus albus]
MKMLQFELLLSTLFRLVICSRSRYSSSGIGGGRMANGDMTKAVYDTNKNGIVDRAEKLATPRNIALSGDVTGSASFDGTANISIPTSVPTASSSAKGLMSAADKAKLDGIAAGANNYVHPATHPASIIVEDSTHRFVTDAEKAAWNANGGGGTGTGGGDMPKSVYDTNNDGIVDKAAKLATARTISLTGSVTGSASFDGSANITITTTGGGSSGGSSNVVNVKSYGAVGNGTTDDTAAIKSAITAATASKQIVYFPYGTYRVLSTITVTTSLDGDRGATILCDTTNMGDTLAVSASNIVIQNLIVDGNNKTHRGIIFATNLSGVTVRYCEVKNIKQAGGQTSESNGIAVYGGSTNIRITDNYVHHVDASAATGIARGILVSKRSAADADSTDIWVTNNRVEEITSSTGTADVFDSDGIVTQGNFAGSDYNTFTGGRTNIFITGNYCYRCQKRGIKVQSPNVMVSNNIIEMASDRLCFSAIGVTAPNVKITNNMINLPFTNSVSSAIQVDGHTSTYANFKNIEVSNNHIRINSSNANCDGIRLFNYISLISIIGNIIENGRYGVRFDASSDSIIVNSNIIKTAFYSGVVFKGAAVNTSVFATNIAVVSNSFITPTAGVSVEGGTKVVISSNTGTVGWGAIVDASVPVVSVGNVS